MEFRHKPNPYPKYGSGLGITLGYPNFGYPILAIVPTIRKSWLRRRIQNQNSATAQKKKTAYAHLKINPGSIEEKVMKRK